MGGGGGGGGGALRETLDVRKYFDGQCRLMVNEKSCGGSHSHNVSNSPYMQTRTIRCVHVCTYINYMSLQKVNLICG